MNLRSFFIDLSLLFLVLKKREIDYHLFYFCRIIKKKLVIKLLDKNVMKKVFMMLLLLFICNIGLVLAQERKFRFELGANYPIGLQKNGCQENHVGFYLNGIYKFQTNPLTVNLKLGYESYTVVLNNTSNSPSNGRSLSLMPTVNYHFLQNEFVDSYVGVGTGVSIDNIDVGIFNEGHKYHFAVAPQVGIRFINHINVYLQYYVTHKDFSRLLLGVDYTF